MACNRVFSKLIECTPNEELIVKENYGELRLYEFCIYNVGNSVVKLKINGADEEITLDVGEGFQIENTRIDVFSCIATVAGKVKFSGLY